MKYLILALMVIGCITPKQVFKDNAMLSEIADSLYNAGHRNFMCMYVYCGETAKSTRQVCISCSTNCQDIGGGSYRCDSLIYQNQ